MTTKIRLLHDTVGIPTGAVAVTQSASDNTTKVATTAYVTTALANLADSAPSTLNTLNELAAALGDDANFSTTVTNSIATKLPLAGGTLTGNLTLYSSAPVLAIKDGGTHGTNSTPYLEFRDGSSVQSSIGITGNAGDLSVWNSKNTTLRFATNNIQRMTITNLGTVLVGKTTETTATDGIELNRQDVIVATRNGDSPLILNRRTSDGDIAVFRKDNTIVGSIGTTSGDVTIDGGSEHSGLRFEASDITPRHNGSAANNYVDLGTSSSRFKDLHLSGVAYATQIDITEGTNARMYSSDAIGEVGSGTFALQVVNAAGSALKPLGFRAEDIRFATGSEERLRIDSSGNILHQGGSPEYHFGTSSASHPNWRIACQENVSHAFEIASGTESAGSGAASDTYTNRFVIKSSGHIGIGTDDPGTPIHIQTNTAETDNFVSGLMITSRSTGTTIPNFGGAIQFQAERNNGVVQNTGLICSMADVNAGTDISSGLRFYVSTAGVVNEELRINYKGTVLGGVQAGSTSYPNYPGTFTSYRTGNAGTTTQNTWGFNANSSGSSKDFGIKVSGAGDYALGVISANEATWMSRLGFDGRIYLTNTTVGSISDRRLKENIVAANSQWNDIKALQFKNYTWKNTERGTGTYLGLIADEVKAVSPNLVEVEYATKETLPENGIDPEYEGVKYSIVWMKAVKALQEAMTKIETLETKLEAAEARIATLEG